MSPSTRLPIFLTLLACGAAAQVQTIRTIGGGYLGDGGPARLAGLYEIWRMAFGPDGTIYIADKNNHRVRRILPDGRITTFAGTGEAGFSGDGGPAVNAKFNFPQSIAVDKDGNVYVGDVFNERVRRIDKNGIISTYAGGGRSTTSNGSAVALSAGGPKGLTVDRNGVLYVADRDYNRVYKVTPDRTLTILTGNGSTTSTGDGGPAVNATVAGPTSVEVDTDGSIYISELYGHRIRKINPQGMISTYAGTGVAGEGPETGPLNAVQFNEPDGTLLVGSDLYIADSVNHRIRRIRNGVISTVAGKTGQRGITPDGTLLRDALFARPRGVTMDAEGRLYICDTDNFRIRRIEADTTVNTVAGAGSTTIGDGGPALASFFVQPAGAFLDTTGSLLVLDPDRNVIRSIDPNGTISTWAGGSEVGGLAGDGGHYSRARFYNPVKMASNGRGAYYIADKENHRIRRIDPNGIITTVAGTVRGATGNDGLATQARLNTPYGVAVHPTTGEVYFSEQKNHCIRRVDGAGMLRLVAGQCGVSGYRGDGGDPRGALFNEPMDIQFDAQGVLYIADRENRRVRKIANDIVSHVAGDGRLVHIASILGEILGYGGPAAQAVVGPPGVLAVEKDGNLLIASDANITRVDMRTGIITLVAGVNRYTFQGEEGPALNAGFNTPLGMAVDRDGAIYISDTLNGRIRVISSASATSLVTFNTNPPGLRTIVDGQEVAHGQQLRWIPGSTHQISLRATQASGDTRYVFSRWSSGEGATQQIRAGSGSSVYTASFDTEYRLNLVVNGSGSVVPEPASSDSGFYPAGSVVRLVPVRGADWTFQGFSGDASGSGEADVTMSRPRNVTADFAPPVPELSVTPDRLTFRAQEGGGATSEQLVTIASTGSPLGFRAAASAGYVRVNAGQTTTPGLARVSIDPGGLRPGTYEAALNITPGGAAAVSVPVTVVVTPAPVKPRLLVDPPVIDIGVTSSEISLTRFLEVRSAGEPIRIGWGVRSGAQWLVVRTDANQSATPARLRLDVLPAGLPAGTYSGRVEVTSPDSDNGVEVIVVNLSIQPEAPRQLFPSVQKMYFQQRLKRQAAAQPPDPQTIDITANQSSTRFYPRAAVSAPVAWLAVDATDGSANPAAPSTIAVTANGDRLQPGVYDGSVELRLNPNGDAVSRIPVQLEVLAPAPAVLTSDRPDVRFDLPAGLSAQPIVWSVRNDSEDPVTLAVTSDASWLRVSAERADASADRPGLVRIDPDVTGLAPGTYAGTVTADSGDTQLKLPVVLTVNQSSRKMVAAERAVRILGKAGARLQSRSLDLFLDGQGAATWTASATTEKGGAWLKLNPATGNLSGGGSQRVFIETTPLAAGTYSGRIRIASPQMDNTEEIVVTMEISADKDAPPEVDRAGVVLVGSPGATQTSRVSISPFYGSSNAYNRDAAIRLQPEAWLRSSKSAVRLDAIGSGNFEFWAQPGNLPAGQYPGSVTVVFPDGKTQVIGVVLIIPSSSSGKLPSADGVCQPSKLTSIFANPEGLNVRVGQAAKTEFAIVDNCGGLLTSGAVSNSFSSGDRPVDLRPVGDGVWRASWVPRLGEASAIGINLDVLAPQGVMEVASTRLVTYLTGRSDAPLIDRTTPFVTPGQRERTLAAAPGGRIVIRGEKLADSRIQSSGPAAQLGNTQVTLGGLPMLLLSVSPSEIEAVVPVGLNPNVAHSLIVTRGGEISAPEPLSVADNWPTIVEAGQSLAGGLDLVLTHLNAASVARSIVKVNGASCTLTQVAPVRNEPGFYFARATGCDGSEGGSVQTGTSTSKTGSGAIVRKQARRGGAVAASRE